MWNLNNKFKYLLLLYLTISWLVFFAQNQNSKWYFGGYAGLDFMTTPPTVLTNGAMSTPEGCASVADAGGNLLFYTNGVTVWNQSHVVMANGTGLLGDPSTTQSSLIAKQPGNSNIYFVFTLDDYGGPDGFRYSIVDMNLASGQGSVTIKNASIYSGNCAEKLTGTRHCNGIDTWIVIHEGLLSTNFRSYLLTSTGLNITPVISGVGAVPTNQYLGSLKISNNGKKLGCVSYQSPNVELFDFDNSTGIVSNPVTLLLSNGAYGCEFSSDCSKFYTQIVGALPTIKVYQWDLCAGSNTAIIASVYSVAATAGFGMQLAPNGKIYITKVTQLLGVINNPNVGGAGCNYVDMGLSLAPQSSYLGITNFISGPKSSPPFTYTVGAGFGCQAAGFTSPLTPTTLIGCAASSYTLLGLDWNFGDPASGASNTSTLSNPVHFFSGLSTFTVQLIFHYSCGGGTDTVRQVVNVNQPCMSVSSTSISCSTLGSATVTSIVGGGPFSYTWMPSAQTNSVATGLGPGTYTITVFDSGSNSIYTATTTFNSIIPFTGTLSCTSSLSCNGASTGSANITNIAGGSLSQNYLWSNGIISYTVPNPANLSAGTWSSLVTDALTGCAFSNTFVITEPSILTLNITADKPATCVGLSAILTGINSGGTPGYTYTWTAGPANNTQTVNEITAGTYIYSLSSTDANNCLTSNTISVNFLPNPTLSVSDVSICPQAVGTLTAFGATTYTWNGVSVGSTFTQSPISNSQYTVVGSSQSCTNMAVASIILLPLPNPSASSNSPRCNGDNLIFTASGGNSYVWDGPNSFSSILQNPNINPVSVNNAGVYTLTVTAMNGCTASITKTIVINPTPTLSVLGCTVCTSQTLNLSANAVGGTSYLWTGPQSFTSINQNPFITNPLIINSGAYTVKITSPQSCTNSATATVSIVAPPSLTVSLSGNGTLCAHALNGSPNTITLTSSGANTYTLTTPDHVSNTNPSGPASPLFSLPPYISGPATATLVGSNGVCSISTTVNFSVIPNPTITVSSPTPVICIGQTYTYTSQGASSYSWGPGTQGLNTYTGPSTIANPTVTSVYSVIGGSLGCNSGMQTSTITVNPLPLISLLPISPTVCIGSKVTLIATGTANSYTWSPFSNINTAYGSTINASPTNQQNYTVVGSLNSCTSTAMITVSVLTLPSPIATVLKPTICLNETITLQGSGGETYEWYGPNSIYYEGQTVNVAASSFIYAGIYTLTVADKNECKASAITSVTINSLPDASLLGTKMQGCVPFKSYFNFYSALATSTSIATQWTVDQKVYPGKTFSKDFTVPGNYTITGNFRDTLTNCINTRTFVVEAYPVPIADFSFLPEKPIENLDEVTFTNTSKGEEQKKWDWFFVNNQGYRSQNKNTEYLFTEAGLYPVAMIVTNSWGCADTVVKALRIESDLTVYVPNVFTPNGDDLNEVFLPIVRAIKSYELLVFDRWGTKIFSTTNTETGWDGTYKGEACKMDVYVWKINLSSVNGEMKTMTGNVMLSR